LSKNPTGGVVGWFILEEKIMKIADFPRYSEINLSAFPEELKI
jgi:hypothetical protein